MNLVCYICYLNTNVTFIFYFRLEILQKMFIVIGGVMVVFAIILLIFGFLATGATRSNVYSGAKCIMGGRITAVFVSQYESDSYCSRSSGLIV